MSKALAKRPRVAPPALVAGALADIEVAIGGRAKLVAALMCAPPSKDLSYVLGLIGDPARTEESLAEICAIGGITAGEILDAYKAGVLASAQVLASEKIGHALPGIVEETLSLSVEREGTCSVCQGVGQVTPEPTKKVPNPEPQTCATCQGGGKLTYPGDLEHKKLSLEMGKLLVKGPGVNIAVSQQVGIMGGASGGALERLQAATDAILYGGEPPVAAPVIEAEVVYDTLTTETAGDRIPAEGLGSSPADLAAASGGSDAPDAPDAPQLEGDWREDLHP